MTTGHSAQRGFTLIEMVVVLSVAAVLLALAVPNFVREGQDAKARALASRFVDDVDWSRQTAMSSQHPVSLSVDADCTWSASQSGAVNAQHSLDATGKAQHYGQAPCSASAATLVFAADGTVSGQTTLTTAKATYQVLPSGTVLSSSAG